MSNDAGTPVGVGALTAGVPAMVGGRRRQVSARISASVRARMSSSAWSMRPAISRLLPSLPIRNGPGAGATA